MAVAKAKARITLYYAPFDEILQTQWDIGIVNSAAVDYLDLSEDAMVSTWHAYVMSVIDGLKIMLSNEVLFVGYRMKQVGEKYDGTRTQIVQENATTSGGPLANNCFAQVVMRGDTVTSPGSGRPRFLKSGMRLSGLSLFGQEAGRLTDAFQVGAQVFLQAIITVPNDPVQNDPAFLCTSGKTMSTISEILVNDIVGRMSERIGNRPQGRPSRN